jgi:hypothetical protein
MRDASEGEGRRVLKTVINKRVRVEGYVRSTSEGCEPRLPKVRRVAEGCEQQSSRFLGDTPAKEENLYRIFITKPVNE